MAKKKTKFGYTLFDYLSAYEGDAPISIIHNIDGDICRGLTLEEVREQVWYKDYRDEYVISFKIIKDAKVKNRYVLLLMM